MQHHPHITSYRILSGDTIDRLSTQVETAIHNGWQPYGPMNIGPSADPAPGGSAVYCQAMVQQSEWYR